MKPSDLSRPDQLILKGIRTLSSPVGNLYTNQKTQAKAKAELTFIGKKKMDKVQNQLYAYNLDKQSKRDNLSEFEELKDPSNEKNYWLNFHGIHDVKLIERIGKIINLVTFLIPHSDLRWRSRIITYF